MKYTCIITDDERPALKLLSAYIEKIPHLELLRSCENAMDCLAALQEEKPDILLLDIQMPGLTGLDLLKVAKETPEVILTTAYREYAIEGFNLDVTDYVVKPFSFERFLKAINKAIEQVDLKRKKEVNLHKEEDHFFVRTNYKMEKIAFQNIHYLESMREYVSIHTQDRRFIVNQTMNRMEEELPSHLFLRVHRSYIIAIQKVQTINGNRIQMGEKMIPIGPSYRKAFFEKIKLL